MEPVAGHPEGPLPLSPALPQGFRSAYRRRRHLVAPPVQRWQQADLRRRRTSGHGGGRFRRNQRQRGGAAFAPAMALRTVAGARHRRIAIAAVERADHHCGRFQCRSMERRRPAHRGNDRNTRHQGHRRKLVSVLPACQVGASARLPYRPDFRGQRYSRAKSRHTRGCRVGPSAGAARFFRAAAGAAGLPGATAGSG